MNHKSTENCHSADIPASMRGRKYGPLRTTEMRTPRPQRVELTTRRRQLAAPIRFVGPPIPGQLAFDFNLQPDEGRKEDE